MQSLKNEDTYKVPKEVEELAEDLSGGWWNYRIVEKRDEWTSNQTGNKYYNISFVLKEVYYKADGSIWSWTEGDTALVFDNIKDVKFLFKAVKKAAKHNVLREVNDKMIDTGKRMKDYTEKDLCNFSWEEEYGREDRN